MPTDTLPELTTAYPVGAEQVAAYRATGFIRLSGLADAGEAAAYRGPIAAAVERLSTETRPLAERDSYGMAFLQVMNLWRQDKGQAAMAAAFVHALRHGGPSPIPFDEIVEVSRVTIELATSP